MVNEKTRDQLELGEHGAGFSHLVRDRAGQFTEMSARTHRRS